MNDLQQPSLFVDSLNDAVRDTCRAVGIKRIAEVLFPDKYRESQESATRYLNDCLNPDRAQFLKGEEIMVIGEEGRKVGCHLIAGYVNQRLHYAPPVPINPEDEIAELQRRYIESVAEQKHINARMERLARGR